MSMASAIRRREHIIRWLATAVIALALAVPAAASKHRWPRPPAWWLRQAACIHHFETIGYRGLAAWRLRGGGMQFLDSTWHSVGGRGSAGHAERSEQLYRAWLNWRRNGRRWGGQWSTAGLCGLR